MKVFVTGADGFLGNSLVRELLDRDYEVKVLIQPGRKNGTLHGLDLETVEGSILDIDTVAAAAGECGGFIHAAADTTTWPSRPGSVRRVNVGGTAVAIEAARKAGIGRYVHVGSANTFGYGPRDDPGDETKPYSAGKYRLEYFDSKYEAHLLVQDTARKGLDTVEVNPTFMVGPWDSKPGFGTVIIAIYQGKMPGCAAGGRNYIHVRDAAAGTVNALERGKAGECYLLGNRNLSYREIFDMIADVIGVEPPKLSFPPLLTKAYGLFNSLYGRLAGKKSVVSLAISRIACDEHYYACTKAEEALDLPKTPIEDAIREAFEWYDKNGYLNMKL